jgi:hypothetical protein
LWNLLRWLILLRLLWKLNIMKLLDILGFAARARLVRVMECDETAGAAAVVEFEFGATTEVELVSAVFEQGVGALTDFAK